MNRSDLIENLNALGITLFVKDGQLKSKGPKGVLTPELTEGIKSNKAELIRLLDIKSTISKMWCGILGVSSVDDDGDFFDLGGHSLLATELIGKLRSKFDINFSVADIFQYPTISSLTDFISEKLGLSTNTKKEKKGRDSGRDRITLD